MLLFEEAQAERPEITMIKYGLVIFKVLNVDAIRSTRFNQELKRLDLPDAQWTRYRGPSSGEYAHPTKCSSRLQCWRKLALYRIESGHRERSNAAAIRVLSSRRLGVNMAPLHQTKPSPHAGSAGG